MIRAKKTLGQNFLNSRAIARQITAAGELSPGETVLEVGPGKGFLTRELLATGAHVVAVEKDARLIPLLGEKFAREIDSGQLVVIRGDIIDLAHNDTLPLPSSYKIVANIPYQITGQIIRLFLESSKRPARIILMVQKEVAHRIIARDGKESMLSLAVKAYGAPRIVRKVPARYFSPQPKVDSAVIAIENISGKHFANRAEEIAFFEILRAGFSHKRKYLSRNLRAVLGEDTPRIMEAIGIAPTARAEEITLATWLTLTHAKATSPLT